MMKLFGKKKRTSSAHGLIAPNSYKMKTSTKIAIFNFTVAFATTALTCFFPEISLGADQGIGDIGNNITENSKGVAEALQYVGYAGGVGSAVWGCFDMYQAGNGRGNATYASGGKKMLIGALLLGIGAVIGSGSTTIFGTDETTGLDDLGL